MLCMIRDPIWDSYESPEQWRNGRKNKAEGSHVAPWILTYY
jgi:hypothetical protein